MLRRVSLANYRSYAKHDFGLHPTATVVVGPNATGKTNLLESLYVLSNGKSFRAKDHELIRHGQEFFRIEVETPDDKIGLGFTIHPKVSKQVDYNQVKRPLARHIGQLPSVLFEPGDLQLLTGPPAGRRRYLDGLLGQTSPAYWEALNKYQKVLKQRNSLLERFDIAAVKQQIFAWDLNLANHAAVIVRGRQELLKLLGGLVSDYYGRIADQVVEIEFGYQTSITVVTDYGEDFMTSLVNNLPRDLGAGFTTIGPHREDFGVKFNGSAVAAVASRGENRSLILALKLAELELINQKGRPPLLLLDDVFSELDDDRRRFLVNCLGQYQSLITTTDADLASAIEMEHAVIKTTELEAYAANR